MKVFCVDGCQNTLHGLERGKELGIEKGKELGLEEGIEIGIGREKIATAKILLNNGVDIDIIEQVTRLSADEITKLLD